MVKKLQNKKKRLIILKKFTILDKKLLIFLETMLKCYLMQITMRDKMKLRKKGHKALTPKEMLQRLPIALAQVKAGNNSEILLNKIRKIVYSLYQLKQITKKV